jgi:hypothetical protein
VVAGAEAAGLLGRVEAVGRDQPIDERLQALPPSSRPTMSRLTIATVSASGTGGLAV